MTPELAIVLWLIAAAIGGYIVAYIRQKGQNLATKEDIAGLTRTQEEIRSELATRSHFSRLRYERELELYRTVWRELSEFYEQSAVSFAWDNKHSDAQKPTHSEEAWQQAGRTLFNTIRDSKPFYPSEVWAELKKVQGLCDELTFIHRHLREQGQEISPDIHKELNEERKHTLAEAKTQLEKVELIIRKRLDEFD